MLLTSLLMWTGAEELAARVVRVSAVLNGLYLTYDLTVSLLRRSPSGDLSALIVHRPRAAAGTLIAVGGAHAAGWAAAT